MEWNFTVVLPVSLAVEDFFLFLESLLKFIYRIESEREKENFNLGSLLYQSTNQIDS